jgi:anti-sigma B factor antagonist
VLFRTTDKVNLASNAHPHDPVEPPPTGSAGHPAPFALRVEHMRDGWIRVLIEGELALTSSEELERAVVPALLARSHVLLDLSQIDFIDSAGLRAMTALVRVARANGCELRLSSDLPDHARRLMEIVGLLPFVPIDTDAPRAGGAGGADGADGAGGGDL